MTSGQKTTFSLLITVLIFSAFAVFSFTEGFKIAEARFYQPKLIANINSHLDDISANMDEYFTTTIQRLEHFVSDENVKSFIETRPTEENVKERTKLTGSLFASTAGLDGIRLIDNNGKYLHYSTYAKDVQKKTKNSISYIDYEKLEETPFDYLKTDNNEKVFFDSYRNQFAFSLPFIDKYSIKRGSIVFYINSSDFTRFLISRNIISLNDNGIVVSPNIITENDGEDKATVIPAKENSGLVFGIPSIGREIIQEAIIEKWNNGLYGTEHLVETENGRWILLTSINSKYARVGWVYNETTFTFNTGIKILLLLCIFFTLFLIIFMLFNLKQDEMVVIKDRIKKFQLGMISEYLDNNENTDWVKVRNEISSRKNEVTNEIKKNLGRVGKKHSLEVDALLDKSWNEILTTLGAKIPKEETNFLSENTAQIKAMLEDILSRSTMRIQNMQPETTPRTVQTIPADMFNTHSEKINKTIEEVEELDEVEELNEVEDLDEVEELKEIAEQEVLDQPEPVEEIEEIEEIEEVEEVETVEDKATPSSGEVMGQEDFTLIQDWDDLPIENDSNDAIYDFVEKFDSLEEEELEEFADKYADLFAEPLEFSEPAPASSDDENNFVEFEISTPDFTGLDSYTNHEAPAKDVFTNIAESEQKAWKEFDEYPDPEEDLREEIKIEIETQNHILPEDNFGESETDDFEMQMDYEESTEDNPEQELTEQEISIPVAEEIPEAENIPEAEELPEAEDISEAEKISEAEDISEAENIPEAEEISEAENIPEAENISEVENIPEEEDISEAEELPEIHEVQEVEELEELVEEPIQQSETKPTGKGLLAHANSTIEKTEEPPKAKGNFSFTSFGLINKANAILEKAKEMDNREIIVENAQGVFSISKTASTSGIKQDPDFKKLVDSVLGK